MNHLAFLATRGLVLHNFEAVLNTSPVFALARRFHLPNEVPHAVHYPSRDYALITVIP
jgi:hypothetical protein